MRDGGAPPRAERERELRDEEPDLEHGLRGGRGGSDDESEQVGAFQALLAGPPQAVRRRWRSSCCWSSRSTSSSRSWSGSTTRVGSSTTRSGTGSSSRSGSTWRRSAPTSRCSAASSAARATTRSTAASTSRPPTRSRWPAWRPRASSRPPGAGGIVLTYWALRKAGMPRRRSACRMVAFLVLTYGVYTARAGRVRDPAAHARAARRRPVRRHGRAGRSSSAIVIGVFLLIALIPQDVERRMQSFAGGYRRTRYLLRLAKGPATLATGVRTAIALRAPPAPRRARGGRRGRLLGAPTSACCGRASRRSAATCRSPCSCRASSSAWRRT